MWIKSLIAAITMLWIPITAKAKPDDRFWLLNTTNVSITVTEYRVAEGKAAPTKTPQIVIKLPESGTVQIDQAQFDQDRRYLAVGYSMKEAWQLSRIALVDLRKRAVIATSGVIRKVFRPLFVWLDKSAITVLREVDRDPISHEVNSEYFCLSIPDLKEEPSDVKYDYNKHFKLFDQLRELKRPPAETAGTILITRNYDNAYPVAREAGALRFSDQLNGSIGDVTMDGKSLAAIVKKGGRNQMLWLTYDKKLRDWQERYLPEHHDSWLVRIRGRRLFVGTLDATRKRQLVIYDCNDQIQPITIPCDGIVEPL